MNEKSYIVATNLARVIAAKDLILNCLAGEDWVITEDERSNLLLLLYKIQDRLFKEVEKCE